MKNKLKKYYKTKILGEEDNKTVNTQKSLYQLIMWVIFIVAVFIFIGISNKFVTKTEKKPNNTDQVINYENLDTIFSIYSNNYDYTINITTSSTTKAKYQGSISNGIDIGTKESNTTKTSYKIENGIITNTETNEIIEDLYEDYLSYFFIPQNVYTYLKDNEYTEEVGNSTKMYKYKSTYLGEDITFNIQTGINTLQEINYSYQNVNYQIKLQTNN